LSNKNKDDLCILKLGMNLLDPHFFSHYVILVPNANWDEPMICVFYNKFPVITGISRVLTLPGFSISPFHLRN